MCTRQLGLVELTLCATDEQAAETEQMRCNNKMRFILAVVAGKLTISNRKRSEIEEQLANEGYDRMPNKGAMVKGWLATQISCSIVLQLVRP